MQLPQLYTELADWWPVLSVPEDYAEEAATYRDTILAHAEGSATTVLELGSGGGNNASHLKKQFTMTLVDLAPGMLAVSRKLNPECEHIEGDMRTVRLDRQFDAVFVHDAILYMTTEPDLRAAIETAFVHCRPGGLVLLAPDCTQETFRETTSQGGHDRGDRSLRYFEWTWDPDPTDSTFVSDMVYLLREGREAVRVVHDRHEVGLFPKATWLRLLTETGFAAQMLDSRHSELPDQVLPLFVGRRLAD